MRILFTLTIFLGSALLFLIQPMVAKMILPIFGGSPGVWNASMLFFQLMLLLGYLYAHLSFKYFSKAIQPMLHIGLFAIALALPIGIQQGYAPDPNGQPAIQVATLLLTMVGLPFFIVSSQAPLMQRWFASTKHPLAADPYFLYSASNVGSMLALAGYPTLLEPTFRLIDQSRIWTLGFGVLWVLTCFSAVMFLKSSRGADAAKQLEPGPRPSTRTRLRWVILAAVPSSLLLGVTAYLTTNIAPVPLLWVVPLALYLATFILAFAAKPLFKGSSMARVATLVALPLAGVLVRDKLEPMAGLATLHLGGFFLIAWACHSLLSESRPSAGRLTEFYLWVSVGGALGGLFNALVAPIAFNTIMEYPIALALAIAILARAWMRRKKLTLHDYLFPAIVFAASIGMIAVASTRTDILLLTPFVVALILMAALALGKPIRFALSMAAVLLLGPAIIEARRPTIFLDRSFFAVARVVKDESSHVLMHGKIWHGHQDMRPEKRRLPISYFHPTGPIGQLFTTYSGSNAKPDVAIVGLGVGTLAAYGEPGQRMTFYEIDPVVRTLALDKNLFTYISDSRAKIDIVMGDARLMIAQAAESQYDIIVLDAFSSDSVPVHLLTTEAIRLYLTKLKPDGILAFQISNRYLNLAPVLARGAVEVGLTPLYQDDEATLEQALEGKLGSRWILMARKPEHLELLTRDKRWKQITPLPIAPLWTDDFSNLLRVVSF